MEKSKNIQIIGISLFFFLLIACSQPTAPTAQVIEIDWNGQKWEAYLITIDPCLNTYKKLEFLEVTFWNKLNNCGTFTVLYECKCENGKLTCSQPIGGLVSHSEKPCFQLPPPVIIGSENVKVLTPEEFEKRLATLNRH